MTGRFRLRTGRYAVTRRGLAEKGL
jgi:hypothetical protein